MGSLCENVVDRGGVATMGQGLVEMGNTSRLYELVVKEREMDERDENWNLGSFKKVTRSLSKRWKNCRKNNRKKKDNKEEKTFSLTFISLTQILHTVHFVLVIGILWKFQVIFVNLK